MTNQYLLNECLEVNKHLDTTIFFFSSSLLAWYTVDAKTRCISNARDKISQAGCLKQQKSLFL